MKRHSSKAFTLIELSIVLVIIGLIVGGVLVGKDLIRAAEVRSQVAQIEKLNTAVNTFKGKYNNYLPGDIPEPDASRFGFNARGQYSGMGDGNGLIQGSCGGSCFCSFCMDNGEAGAFWSDLSRAALIEGSFNGLPSDQNISATPTTIGQRFPAAALGRGNYIYVYGGQYAFSYLSAMDNKNYFAVSVFVSANSWNMNTNPGMTVRTAYAIDQKMDDALPQSGKVTANYYNYTTNNYSTSWAEGGGGRGTGGGTYQAEPSTLATPATSTTCYDNGNVTGVQKYSLGQNNGDGINCALSFQIQ